MRLLMHVELSGACHQCNHRTIEIDLDPEDCTTWPPTEDDPKLIALADFTIWNEVLNYGIEIVEES